MKSLYLLSTLILFLLSSEIKGSDFKNYNFDFSGIDKFWDIILILEKDIEPSEEQWDSLFKTPGYRVLISQEFSRDFFERNFCLAFMPSKEVELNY